MTGKKLKTGIGKEKRETILRNTETRQKVKKTSVGSEIDDATPGTSRDSSSESAQPISASRTKLALPDSSSESSDEESDSEFQGQGYRLIDLDGFSSTLSSAHVCEEGEMSLHILPSLHVVDGSAPNVSTVSYSFSVTACYETFYTAVDILNGNLCSTLVFFSLFIFSLLLW